jgi:PTH1 family peptidyl-tRNA hydrolase
MRLVVGLGNPGSEFIGTRHNVGWDALDAVAARLGWIGPTQQFNQQAKAKFDALTLDGTVPIPGGGTEKVLLLKPTTYVNLSGRAVAAAMAFFQLAPDQVLVVLDDMALPCGRLRIRKGGSDGGHNGLRDVERALATQDYPRLRIGIDPPPPYLSGRDYVLGRLTEPQRKLVDVATQRAADAVLTWIEKGIDAAMNAYNPEDNEPSE